MGKRLPKNLNETRTNFKAKTLVLKQQFNLEKEGPVSHRNLSWKELLAHLGHYNKAIKLDAIGSIKELLADNRELLRLEIFSLLEHMCPLFVDREYKVREASMQLFKSVVCSAELSSITSRHVLRPFYSLLGVRK